MRYPNTRYGCPGTMEYYAQGRTIKELAKHLKRSERTVKDWMEGKKKIPFWVPELLRLQHKEHIEMLRQMNLKPLRLKLGIVGHNATIIEFPNRRTTAHNTPERSYAPVLLHCEAMGHEVAMGEAIKDSAIR